MFDLVRPCTDCPFRKEHGIRVTRGRAKEIAGCFITEPGAIFSCHKTCKREDDDGEYRPDSSSSICVGGLMFAEKQGKCVNTYRIGERLGLYKVDQLDKSAYPDVFDNLRQMLKTAWRK